MPPIFYGQLPYGAMPFGAYPLYGRVGWYLPTGEEAVAGSGVHRQQMHMIYRDQGLKNAIEDDKDLLELLQLIVSTGVLE